MDNPSNIRLPFFAYGIFKPGQLGYLRLIGLVAEAKPDCEIKGALMIRDGLPIIDEKPDYSNTCRGTMLTFKPDAVEAAYQRIAEIEPDKHYRWGVTSVQAIDVNVLFGRSPRKGSVFCEDAEWDGRSDPLFTAALEVIDEALQANAIFEWDLKPLFKLQMAYLLLWSAIERYVSLRYDLGDDRATAKVFAMASEAAFNKALQRHVTEKRFVVRSHKPDEKVFLDPGNPKKSLDYYYQIRSNIVHRGKAVMQDHDRIYASLEELLNIFRYTLDSAFKESAGEMKNALA